MEEIKAPNKYQYPNNKKMIFLAGSIEMGKAENWQEKVKNELTNKDIILLNPRRNDWDSSWEQKIENDKFRKQVEWELQAMEQSDLIIVNFDGRTKSPITLMELGLFKNKKMIVCCPKNFWRRGNVEIVCKRYNISFYENLNDLIKKLKHLLNIK